MQYGKRKEKLSAKSVTNKGKTLSFEQQESRKQNILGFKKYKQKDYSAARDYFRKAVKLDPEYSTAHYNLACMNSLINEFCDYDDGEALKSLKRAIELDGHYAEKAISDSDLRNVSSTFVFRRLTKQIRSDGDAVRYLTESGKIKKCHSPGSYSICTVYRFVAGGKVEVEENGPPSGEKMEVKTEKKKGTFRVERNRLILIIEGQKQKQIDLDHWFHPSNEDRCGA